ncbi:hypothetical protein ACXWOD_10615, partial [Streptococcus pyogenes]
KKIFPLTLLLAMAPMGVALAGAGAATPVIADAQSVAQTAPAAQAASSDCSLGFFSRLAAAYREDAQPADPNAPTPARRAMESP